MPAPFYYVGGNNAYEQRDASTDTIQVSISRGDSRDITPDSQDSPSFIYSISEAIYKYDVNGNFQWNSLDVSNEESITFDFDTNTLYVGGEGVVAEVDKSDGSVITDFTHSYGLVRKLEFDPDTGDLFGWCDGGDVVRWTTSGTEQWSTSVGTGCRDGNVVGSYVCAGNYGDSGTIYRLNKSDGTEDWSATDTTGDFITACDINGSGEVVIADLLGPEVAKYDATGTRTWTYSGSPDRPESVEFGESGVIYVGDESSNLIELDSSGSENFTENTGIGQIRTVVFTEVPTTVEQISATQVSGSGSMNTTTVVEKESVSATQVSGSASMNTTTIDTFSTVSATQITASASMNTGSAEVPADETISATSITASASMNTSSVQDKTVVTSTQVSASATMNTASATPFTSTGIRSHIYVADNGDGETEKIDASGNDVWTDTLAIGEFQDWDIDDSGNIYVGDNNDTSPSAPLVEKYDDARTLQWSVNPFNTDDGNIRSITSSKAGSAIYATRGATGVNTVIRMDGSDGSVIWRAGDLPSLPVDSILVPNESELLVSDATGNVTKLDANNGDVIWSSNGNGSGEPYYEVDVDSGGNVYALDRDAGEVDKITFDGNYVTSYTFPAGNVRSLSTDLNGGVYLGNGATDEVVKLDTSLNEIWRAGTYNVTEHSVTARPGSGVYAVDFDGNNPSTVYKLDPSDGSEIWSNDVSVGAGFVVKSPSSFTASISATQVGANASMNDATSVQFFTATPITASASMNTTTITEIAQSTASPVTASASMNATSITRDSVISTPVSASTTMGSPALTDIKSASPTTASATMNDGSITADSVISTPITASATMNTITLREIGSLADATPITASATMNAGSVTRAGASATAVGGTATMNASGVSQFDLGASPFTASALMNDSGVSSFDKSATQIAVESTVNDGSISNLTLSSAKVAGVGAMNDGSITSFDVGATQPLVTAIMRIGAVVEGVNVTIDGDTVRAVTIDGETVFSLTIDGDTSER